MSVVLASFEQTHRPWQPTRNRAAATTRASARGPVIRIEPPNEP